MDVKHLHIAKSDSNSLPMWRKLLSKHAILGACCPCHFQCWYLHCFGALLHIVALSDVYFSILWLLHSSSFITAVVAGFIAAAVSSALLAMLNIPLYRFTTVVFEPCDDSDGFIEIVAGSSTNCKEDSTNRANDNDNLRLVLSMPPIELQRQVEATLPSIQDLTEDDPVPKFVDLDEFMVDAIVLEEKVWAEGEIEIEGVTDDKEGRESNKASQRNPESSTSVCDDFQNDAQSSTQQCRVVEPTARVRIRVEHNFVTAWVAVLGFIIGFTVLVIALVYVVKGNSLLRCEEAWVRDGLIFTIVLWDFVLIQGVAVLLTYLKWYLTDEPIPLHPRDGQQYISASPTLE